MFDTRWMEDYTDVSKQLQDIFYGCTRHLCGDSMTHSYARLRINKRWRVTSNDQSFCDDFKKTCQCKYGSHHGGNTHNIVMTRLPSQTHERIAQLLSHEPGAIISQFCETALRVSESFVETGDEQLCGLY